MPTIITTHIAKVKRRSIAVHGASLVILIAAIAVSYAMARRHLMGEMDEIRPGERNGQGDADRDEEAVATEEDRDR